MKLPTSTKAAAGAIALLLTITACSNGSPATETTTDETEASDGAETEVEGPINVLSYSATDTFYGEFYDRCEELTGVKFDVLVIPMSEIITKSAQLTASGNPPDMLSIDNPFVATLADAGVLAPIDLEAGGLDAADFVTGPLESGQYDGVQYALPVGNNGEVIVYDVAALEAAGVEVPTSWDELIAAATALKTDERGGFGMSFQGGQETLNWNWYTQLWSSGGSFEDLTSKAAVDSAEFWASFIRDGLAPQEALQWGGGGDVSAAIVAGELAMGQVGTWELPDLLAQAKEAGIEIGIAQQVSPDGSPPVTAFGGEVLAAGAGATGAKADVVNTCITSWYSDLTLTASWDEQLGYVPSYVPLQEEVLSRLPELKVLAEQLANSRPRTTEVGADFAEYSAAVAVALQKIATGSASAEQAMQEAATEVGQG